MFSANDKPACGRPAAKSGLAVAGAAVAVVVAEDKGATGSAKRPRRRSVMPGPGVEAATGLVAEARTSLAAGKKTGPAGTAKTDLAVDATKRPAVAVTKRLADNAMKRPAGNATKGNPNRPKTNDPSRSRPTPRTPRAGTSVARGADRPGVVPTPDRVPSPKLLRRPGPQPTTARRVSRAGIPSPGKPSRLPV